MPAGSLPIYCNEETMGLPSKIVTNIKSSHYFRSLFKFKVYHEVLGEIKREVKHLEPSDMNLLVSTAFCLLYKLFTLRLTEKQMKRMLDCDDNVYVRGIGFLYLRLTTEPEDLWYWFEHYLEDDEMIQYQRTGGPVPLGVFVSQLLQDHKYCGIFFKQLPVKLRKEISDELEEHYGSLKFPDKFKSYVGKGKSVRDSGRGALGSPPPKRRRTDSFSGG
eukprot:CAMPEP_0119150200 /NCGR_PEP_ID=MMETSP1310-20130426/44434_1 /TAXON_ID=464262 /ORGANISM="Genus nov. species nov., Strain RCC2339" /LENGTH=217 /DNA_ID=CAMNT_0007142355 /DNA_START=65 /DNA_END=714 /DNA_ORIENTATION=+